jgi:serine/threonine protein kinase
MGTASSTGTLKPGNVMLVQDPGDPGGDEVVKLVDFGIARLSEADAVIDERLTLTGKLTGTPNYMSPEQIRGEPVDARSDVYALGLMLHEMLTGRPAFSGRTPITIVMAQLNDPPPRLRDSVGGRLLPPGLEEVVERAVRKSRGERFNRATDLRRALEAVNRRSELSALWADKGTEPEAVFAGLARTRRRHRRHHRRRHQTQRRELPDAVPGPTCDSAWASSFSGARRSRRRRPRWRPISTASIAAGSSPA